MDTEFLAEILRYGGSRVVDNQFLVEVLSDTLKQYKYRSDYLVKRVAELEEREKYLTKRVGELETAPKVDPKVDFKPKPPTANEMPGKGVTLDLSKSVLSVPDEPYYPGS
jgi:hypothetical protein